MWPPTRITSSGFSTPRISPITLCDVTGASVRLDVRKRNLASGSFRSTSLRRSAAAVEIVTAGIFGVPSS